MAVTTEPSEVVVDAGDMRITGRGVLQAAMEQQQVSEEGATIRWEDRVVINARRYQPLSGRWPRE
jgi:hypothetical protein